MKTQLIATTIFALAAIAAGPASAQYLRPGLWQFHATTPGKGDGTDPMAAYAANMRKEMKSMAPAQRKEMEAMLAQMAASETRFDATGIHSKVCISKKQVQNLDKMMGKDNGNCTSQRSALTGGQIKMNMSCTNPPSTGSAIIKFQGDTGYSMESTMTVNMGGQRTTHKSSATGKWLSSDCGKVAPDDDE